MCGILTSTNLCEAMILFAHCDIFDLTHKTGHVRHAVYSGGQNSVFKVSKHIL